MPKEIISPCPALILAEGYKNIPPAVCRRGFTPEVIEKMVFADSRCNLVKNGLTNIHCQKITKEAIRPGQATPEMLAQPRIIRLKKN